MNLNLLTYLIFFISIAFITVRVGWIFYKNGVHFIQGLIPEDPHLVGVINKLLLVGYYLVNIGYAATVVSFWNHVNTIEELVSSLALKAGGILIGLGLLHFINIGLLQLCQTYRRNKLNQQKLN